LKYEAEQHDFWWKIKKPYMKIAGFLLFFFLPFQALLGQVSLEGRVVSDEGEAPKELCVKGKMYLL
jgi:hypothetical protein